MSIHAPPEKVARRRVDGARAIPARIADSAGMYVVARALGRVGSDKGQGWALIYVLTVDARGVRSPVTIGGFEILGHER